MLCTTLALSVSFAACGEDSKETPQEQPQEEVIEDFPTTDFTFNDTSGEQTFTFTTATAWNIQVAETRSGADWCSVEPSSGEAGTHTVTITPQPNETYDDRSVTVTLRSGSESRSFEVTQKQTDAILLTSDKFEVNQEGGTIVIEVKSNINYTATIDEPCKNWITESNDSRALTTAVKKYHIAANEDTEKREGKITFSNGALTETVHIYQFGGSVILLNPNEYYANAAGEEFTVELRSNCDYEVIMPDDDWIQEIVARSMSSHTLRYTVLSNEAYDNRQTQIIYHERNNPDIADTLTVYQAQKDAIIVSDENISAKAEGEVIEVKLSANIDFEMLLPDVDWLSESSSRALQEYTKYLQVAENTGSTSRTAQVIFRNTESGVADTLTVSQASKLVRVKIHVEKPGDLPDMIPEEDKYKITELEVSGYLGGRDLELLATMAGRRRYNFSTYLTYLDMSKATIVGDGVPYHYTIRYHYPTDKTIGSSMFADCQGLQTIILPDNTISVGDNAFDFCPMLQKVILPEKLDSIKSYAFSKCDNLTQITLPKRITFIGNYAFSECHNLITITIPNSVTSMGRGIFSGCTKLTNVELFQGMSHIPDFTFSDCSNLGKMTLPKSVKSIGVGAFWGSKNLSITIPETIDSIEWSAFDKCTNLTITIPIKFIKGIHHPYLFIDCEDLKLTIADGATTLPQYAFSDCTGLTSINLPNTLKSIGDWAFENCI